MVDPFKLANQIARSVGGGDVNIVRMRTWSLTSLPVMVLEF